MEERSDGNRKDWGWLGLLGLVGLAGLRRRRDSDVHRDTVRGARG
jgi:MYXO-CTERM domain-containing protein